MGTSGGKGLAKDALDPRWQLVWLILRCIMHQDKQILIKNFKWVFKYIFTQVSYPVVSIGAGVYYVSKSSQLSTASELQLQTGQTMIFDKTFSADWFKSWENPASNRNGMCYSYAFSIINICKHNQPSVWELCWMKICNVTKTRNLAVINCRVGLGNCRMFPGAFSSQWDLFQRGC